jgi:uncharacterized membrane protein
MNEVHCGICEKSFSEDQLIKGHGIHHGIENLLRMDHPGWNDQSLICRADFNTYRIKYVAKIIEEENGSIQDLDNSVLKSINENDIITANTNQAIEDTLKVGDRIADRVASFGGSWKFIIAFFAILLVWIMANTIYLMHQPFDPYPFILMNLILSCLAAIQAPIIMMSQNRQGIKDRIQSENDYKINLKSEIEIRTLHEKVDHLLLDQWAKMMSIQEMQIEILEEIRSSMAAKK